MNRKFVMCGVIALGAGIAQADLISNGSFEESPLYLGGAWASLGGGSTAIDGWTVFGTGVDYVGTLWAASDGERSVDLNMRAAGGGVAQTFSTIIGETYEVEFDLSANMFNAPDGKILEISAAGEAKEFEYDHVAIGASAADPKWQRVSWIFTANDASTTLSFEGINAGAFGAAIDNVTVNEVGGVPAPSAALALGLGGLAASRRRRS